MKFSVFCISALLLSSCSLNVTDNVVAEVNGETIKASELEHLTSQEMFDELNRVYQIKSLALDQLINEKLIDQEAKKHCQIKSEYLDDYYKMRLDSGNIDKLLAESGISASPLQKIQGASFNNIDSESIDGKIMIDKTLKRYLKCQLIDSLRKDKSISKYIYPPVSPNMILDDLHVYYRGNLKSKVTVIVASDFECEKCIQFHNRYNSIYNKYKDKVRFGYVNFSSSATLAGLACDAANNQDKYWEFNDSLFSKNGQIDSATVYGIARNMNLNMNEFHLDVENSNAKNNIDKTNDELIRRGLFATPTIIINGRLIFDSGSEFSINNLIESELNK